MERITRFRAGIVLLLFVALIGFYIYRLYDEQIIKTDGGSISNETTFTTLTRVKAARGEILDRNGNVLVSNRASYDLVINHYVLVSAKGTNDYLYQLVKLCQELGIAYNEHFPISQERPFTYTLEEYNSAYQGYFQEYLKYMDGLDSDITAPLLIETLREVYGLPAEWSDEDARLVIGLRYELALRNCVPSMANYVFLNDVSQEEMAAIGELNIPGMNVEASTVREYQTEYAAHILGFVGAMSAEQWEYYKQFEEYSMDAQVGQAGFEAAFEEYLHGVDGWRMDTVNQDGTLVSSEYLVEPKAGSNVQVTIDIVLQGIAEESLARHMEELRNNENPNADGADAEGAAVVAMDPNTGQVLVCASYPTYDPATYFENYNEILKDPLTPLFNRALDATYPPGSAYKPVMVVAAIDSGLINSATLIEDKGIFDPDNSPDNKYKDFEPTCLTYALLGYAHGEINAAQALKVSCNYFFYELGDRIKLSIMDNTGKMMGLGESTGIELPESTGHRANAETKAELFEGEDGSWYQGDQILAAIGQSEHRFTPMQLCVYVSTLATQGDRYRATFLNRIVSSDNRSLLKESQVELMSHLDISDEAYMSYMQGMCMVTQESGGTAYSVFRDYPIQVAGKTGTAETDKEGKSDNGSFICFAPAYDPEIAISVYGEQAGHGVSVTVVAKDILDSYFEVGAPADVNSYENKLS